MFCWPCLADDWPPIIAGGSGGCAVLSREKPSYCGGVRPFDSESLFKDWALLLGGGCSGCEPIMTPTGGLPPRFMSSSDICIWCDSMFCWIISGFKPARFMLPGTPLPWSSEAKAIYCCYCIMACCCGSANCIMLA